LSLGSGANAFNIAIGTGASERIITIGNATTATSVVLNAGTAGVSVGTNAIAHPVVVGTVTGAGNTTVQAGTGALVVNGGGDVTVDAVGVLEFNSSGGIIGIGNDGVAQNINIGTGAAARDIVIGNATGTTSVSVNAGTGDSTFAANATDHGTTIGSTIGASQTVIQGGTDGVAIISAGNVAITPGVDTQAAAAVTINARVGVATFTGLTTGAGLTQNLTITNDEIAADSGVLVSISNLGANDAQCYIRRTVPAAGSMVCTMVNGGAAALNGNVIVSFIVLAN